MELRRLLLRLPVLLTDPRRLSGLGGWLEKEERRLVVLLLYPPPSWLWEGAGPTKSRSNRPEGETRRRRDEEEYDRDEEKEKKKAGTSKQRCECLNRDVSVEQRCQWLRIGLFVLSITPHPLLLFNSDHLGKDNHKRFHIHIY